MRPLDSASSLVTQQTKHETGNETKVKKKKRKRKRKRTLGSNELDEMLVQLFADPPPTVHVLIIAIHKFDLLVGLSREVGRGMRKTK